jgi:hypothetical protein
MARNKKATPQVENIHPYLDGVAKYLVDRLYGPDGPPWGTKLTEIEDVVLALRQHLSDEMLAQILQRQADSQERPPQYQQCPSCQRPVKPDEPEPRQLVTRAGEAQWSEPRDYCHACRRAFFPSGQKFGD